MMETSTKVNNNRARLLAMMAQCEDITRTNNRVYQLLTTIMNNPGIEDNLKESIEDLYIKISRLKKGDISGPLMDSEKTIVPTPADASQKEDPDWETMQQQRRQIEAENQAKAEAEAEAEAEKKSNKRKHSNRPRKGRKANPTTKEGRKKGFFGGTRED